MSQFNLFHKSVPVLTVMALSAALINSVQAVQFYKWIDKNGSTHYSQEHPGKNAVKIVKTVLVDDTPPPIVTSSVPNPVSDQTTTTSNQPENASGNPTPQQTAQPVAQPPVLSITPPPANKLIQPSQEQTRPAFSQK